MNNNQENSYPLTPRENFLMSLLNKVIAEYKSLLGLTKSMKPLKIVEIIHLTIIPGETIFAVQLVNKNCIINMTAAEIISQHYDLNDFSPFHADMVRHAAKGKLIEYLKLSDSVSPYKVIAKKFDSEIQQYVFTIEAKDSTRFMRTAAELSKDKDLLMSLDIGDIYDIGYTQGSESVLKEKAAMVLARQ